MTRLGIALGMVLALGAESAADPPPTCATYRTEARYRPYGYDHIVILHNGCDRRVSCEVSTNANPRPVTVTVEAGRDREVVTFLGSPSREFTANVRCALAP